MSAPAPPRRAAPTAGGVEPAIAARRAAVAEAARRRRRGVLGSLAALAGIALGAAAVAASPLFDVEEVVVAGVDAERAEEIEDVVGIAPGDNLLLADTSGGQARVERLAWVAEAQVWRMPPAQLVVEVAQRAPAAVVRLADRSWVVDADGVVLRGGAEDGVPRIDAPGAALPAPGERIGDAGIANALAFHRDLPDGVAGRVDRYEAPSASELRVLLASDQGEVWARVGRAEDVGRKAAVLAGLLAELPDEVTGAEEIDVRAPENPVLVPSEAEEAP